jgi:hypothetical protein
MALWDLRGQGLPLQLLFHPWDIYRPAQKGPKNMSDNYTPEQISDMEREASHIAYAVSTAIVNSKFSDQERDLVRQMVTEAAQQLSIKMALILPPKDDRPRFNIRAYIKTSNMGQRELKLGQEETVG